MTDLPLKAEMERRFHLPVYVENDVNVAVLGEGWRGAGAGQATCGHDHHRDRYRLVLTLNGELYRGCRRASGEIGFMVTDSQAIDHWNDPVVTSFGYLESRAGGPAILRQYRRRVRNSGGRV